MEEIIVLKYYLLPEVISLLFSIILCIHLFSCLSLTDQKQRMLLVGSLSSIASIIFNIISSLFINVYKNTPEWITILITTLYFSLILMVPLVLSNYAVLCGVKKSESRKIIFNFNGTVYSIYVFILILNIHFGWLFDFTKGTGYQRGFLLNIVYVLSAYYALVTVISVIFNKQNMSKKLYLLFLFIPLVSVSIIVIQYFFKSVLFSGTASFTALFLAYLTIQSDMMDYDMSTGLLTESKLKKYFKDKNFNGYLYEVTFDNFAKLANYIGPTEYDKALLQISRKMNQYFGRRAFHITTNRFAAITNNLELIENSIEDINDFVNDLNLKIKLSINASIKAYHAALKFDKGEKSYENIVEIVNNLFNNSRKKDIHDLAVCNDKILYQMERKRQIFAILKRELNLESQQFQIYYQPIYSLKEKKFIYMEALSRLKGTELGDISPQDFVEVAEERGLIEQLGNIAFEKVCKFISENKSLVKAVSINFSVYQMSNPKIVQFIKRNLERFDLEPSNIIMEITESIFIENFEIVYRNMIELALMGIRFYLDDFGTGYSNLANVVALPFSTIKFDRSLVLMMEESQKNTQLFANLLSTFKDAGLNILVEGVETEEQRELVESSGADYIQGFLYSKPLQEDICLQLLRDQKA